MSTKEQAERETDPVDWKRLRLNTLAQEPGPSIRRRAFFSEAWRRGHERQTEPDRRKRVAMNDITTLREFLEDVEFYADSPTERHYEAQQALDRVEAWLRALTDEHSSQCQCPGCSLLRSEPTP